MVTLNCSLFAAAVVSFIITATTLLLQLILLNTCNNKLTIIILTKEAILLFKAESENKFTVHHTQNQKRKSTINFVKMEHFGIRNEIKQMNQKFIGIISPNSEEDGQTRNGGTQQNNIESNT